MRLWKSKVFKVGLKFQLMTLVILVALLSLLILAITTGLYFTTNYRSTREDRLQTIAQLKASQMLQTLNFLYFQAYGLTTRDQVQSSLVSYRAGNTSESNWSSALDTINQFLQSSLTFASVRVYDARFNRVVTSDSNWSSIYVPSDVQAELYPLDQTNFTIRNSLDTAGMLTGPVQNDSTTMVLSMTIPVFYTASILFDDTALVGYVTTVMSASSFKSALDDNTTLADSDVIVLTADPNNGTVTANTTFHAAFPVEGISREGSKKIGSSYIATQALRYGRTGTKHLRNFQGVEVVAGYCPVDFDIADWAALVLQKRSTFDQPSTKLVQITIGVCIGIAVFMAILTYPLTHWAVQPILRLQRATELIAEGRGLQAPGGRKKDPSSGGSTHSSIGGGALPYSPSASPFPRGSTQGDRPLSEVGSMSTGLGEAGIGASYLHNARIPPYSRIFQDELSKLTETFNAMTDELDRQYTHLEDRVKARTKQLEAAKIQAEAANDAKTVFIANISHELRTPLNGILGMTAIAMAETDASKVQQSLKLIFRSGELLLHILTELLTFSKNSLKRSKLENADFCIMEVALQIKSIFGKLAKDQHVKLSITLTPNEIRRMVLYGDSNRIIQIVMNLVSNSLKFTPIDGKVTVVIRNLGEYDEEKSRLDDYKHVYVKPNSVTMINEKTDNVFDNELSTSNETSSNSAYEEDDTKSIMTVSTSSYDDNFFKTQFKLTDPGSEEEKIKTKPILHEKTWVFEFVVEDTGPGIEKSLQEAVFEPFIQGDQTLSRQFGGTGLGLSICRQLATMMHGVMELESAVGVGSKFIFRVPLLQRKEMLVEEEEDLYEDEFNIDSKKNRSVRIVEPKRSGPPKDDHPQVLNQGEQEVFTPTSDKAAYFDKSYWNSTGTAKSISSHSSKSDGSSNFKHLKILVAEDNNVNQEVIKRMLRLEGFIDLDMARDGEETIELLKSNIETQGLPYDIVFMDVQMPKVDGLMATKIIRAELQYHGPIVALTAFADESNVKECIDCGMSGFLSKPIRRSQLRRVLEEFCGISHQDLIATPSEEVTKLNFDKPEEKNTDGKDDQ